MGSLVSSAILFLARARFSQLCDGVDANPSRSGYCFKSVVSAGRGVPADRRDDDVPSKGLEQHRNLALVD